MEAGAYAPALGLLFERGLDIVVDDERRGTEAETGGESGEGREARGGEAGW